MSGAEQALFDRMELALRLVLLFHSTSPWDAAKKAEWSAGARRLLGDANAECTTKKLCDAIRVALK